MTEANRAGFERATALLRSAVRLSGARDPTILAGLGDALFSQEKIKEAEAEYIRACNLVGSSDDKPLRKAIGKHLIAVAFHIGNSNLMQARFSEYVNAGLADSTDWSQEAGRLFDLKAYTESGETWLNAADLFHEWTFVCSAVTSFACDDKNLGF
jgi:hypothetical protein